MSVAQTVAAQRDFVNRGGVYSGILAAKYETGELVPPHEYKWQEYPKSIRLSRGMQTTVHRTTVIRGKEEVPVEHTYEREVFEDIIVNNEDDEMRVLHGGKSAEQMEEERQALVAQARQRGLNVDASWTFLRLQREIGAAPSREAIDALQARVVQLETEAVLRARIAELEALVAPRAPADDADAMRDELRSLGIEPDGRWGLSKLRSELDRATSARAA